MTIDNAGESEKRVRLRLVSDGTVRGTHVYVETLDGQRFEVEDVVSVNWHASANDEPTCRLEINDLVADVAGGEVEAVDPEVERKELAALEKSLDELASADDRRALAGEDTPGGADALSPADASTRQYASTASSARPSRRRPKTPRSQCRVPRAAQGGAGGGGGGQADLRAALAGAAGGGEVIDVHILRTSESRNPIGSVAPLDMMIAIGFGSAVVTHDGKTVLDGDRALGWLRVRDAEKRAKRDPRGCWQIHIDGPLWSAVWERKRPGKWVCIEAGRGFA